MLERLICARRVRRPSKFVVVAAMVLAMLLNAGRFALFTVLPASLLLVLSLASGLVRTTAVGVFGLAVLLRVAMAVVDWLGDCAPAPRWMQEVAR